MRFGFDNNPRLFFKKIHTLNPQSYGRRGQKWLNEQAGLYEVGTDIECGDAMNELGVHFEYKFSYKTPSGNYSFIQIRPHHQVSGYCFVAINPDDNYSVQYFYLTRAQALYEAYNIGSSAHGKITDKQNKHKEYKISIKDGSEDYIRWVTMYRVPDLNTLVKILRKKPFTDEKRAQYGKIYRKIENKKGLLKFFSRS